MGTTESIGIPRLRTRHVIIIVGVARERTEPFDAVVVVSGQRILIQVAWHGPIGVELPRWLPVQRLLLVALRAWRPGRRVVVVHFRSGVPRDSVDGVRE